MIFSFLSENFEPAWRTHAQRAGYPGTRSPTTSPHSSSAGRQETTKVYGTAPRKNIVDARRNAWRTHEEGTERHTRDGHTAVSLCSSEPHMAAHTTGTAHPAKCVETHTCVDEDGGRRQRTRRESDTENVMAPGAAQPCASTSVEPSGAASNSYRSRETIRILAEAKSSFIQ